MIESEHIMYKRKLFGHVDLFIIPVLVIVGLSFLLFWKLKQKEQKVEKEVRTNKAQVVKVAPVVKELWSESVEVIGIVESTDESQLTSLVEGDIVEISPNFQIGNHVTKGEVLMKVNSSKYREALSNAKALLATRELEYEQEQLNATQVKAELEYFKDSEYSRFAIREPHLKVARAQIDSAQQAVNQALSNLENCNFFAPSDGEVKTRNVNYGEFVVSGQPLGELFSRKNWHVKAELSDRNLQILGGMKQVKEINIVIDEFSGKSFLVSRISSVLNPKTFSLPLFLKLEEEIVAPLIGSYLSVTLSAPTERLLVKLPRFAVFSQKVVTITNDSRVQLIPVKVVQETGEVIYVEPFSLPESSRIPASRLKNITNGMPVRIIPSL